MPEEDRGEGRAGADRPFGDGCGDLLDQIDWSHHPLGPRKDWPSLLDQLVRLALGSDRPSLVCWGEARSAIYNDAFAALLGDRHPGVFGAAVDVVWGDSWRALAPLADVLFEGGAPLEDKTIAFGTGTPRHLCVAHTPVEEGGKVIGMFCPCVDVTDLVKARESEERRGTLLRLALDSGEMGVWQANVTRKTMTLDEPSRSLLGIKSDSEEIPFSDLDRWVHPDDVASLKSARDRAARHGRFEHEYRIYTPGKGERWIHGVGEIKKDARGVPVVGYGLNFDVSDRRRAEEALRASELRFRTITEAMPQIAFSATKDGTIDFVNGRWKEFTGAPAVSAMGDGWADFFDPEDAVRIGKERGRCIETGEWFQAEGRLSHHGGGRRWILARALPIQDEKGEVTRWLGTLTDIDDLKKAQEHRKLVTEELGHRLKNVIALVQAVTLRTFDNSAVPPELLDTFRGRLGALANAHKLLFATEWKKADLEELARDSLTACGAAAERMVVAGPAVTLPPKQSVSIAMALHELCTNAVKYGALSNGGGSVEVRWEVSRNRLFLRWIESGGPPVTPPRAKGFGMTMVERVLAADLGGCVSMDFRPEGLRCVIDAPLAVDATLSGDAAPDG